MNQTDSLQNLLFGLIGFSIGALTVKAFSEESGPQPDFVYEQVPMPAEGIPLDPAGPQPQPPATAVNCHLCDHTFDVEGDLRGGEEVECPKCGNETQYRNEAG